jgi:hypothetical protein
VEIKKDLIAFTTFWFSLKIMEVAANVRGWRQRGFAGKEGCLVRTAQTGHSFSPEMPPNLDRAD